MRETIEIQNRLMGLTIPASSFRKEDLRVGDKIIFYRRLDGLDNVAHRIIEINIDDRVWYCVTQGDNLLVSDGRVRWEDIHAVVVAIIY
jgi:pyruvate kinase